MSSSVPQLRNLWAVATDSLGSEDKTQINVYQADKATVLGGLLEITKEKQRRCIEKRWKFTKGSGEIIIIRDLFEKTAQWLEKFKAIGDVAVQFDPTHASLPWAGIRFLLQISINDAQAFGAVAEGIEVMSRLVARYAIFEAVYLTPRDQHPTAAQQKLSEALVTVYSACLTYLSRAGRYYQRSTTVRLARSVVESAATINSYLDAVLKEEIEVERLAHIIHSELTLSLDGAVSSLRDQNIAGFQSLEKLVRSLEQPLIRVAGPLADFQDNLKAKERRKVLLWLSTVRYREHHEATNRDVLPGTGDWLFRRPEYIRWQESSSSSILWLHGIPGCGKSKLSSLVVQRLLDAAIGNADSAPVAFFYCSGAKAEPDRADPVAVLRAILKQLSYLESNKQIRPTVSLEFIRRQLNTERDGLDVTPLSLEECTQLLVSVTSDCPATIVIDGLDEADENRCDLLDSLRTIVENSSSVVKVFVSSRDDAGIALHLQDASSIYVTAADNSVDISAFVNHAVASAITKKRLLGGKISSQLNGYLISALKEGAGGMFLWPSLHLEQLCNQQRFKLEADIVAALKAPPSTLTSTFDQIYGRINDYGDRAKEITKQVFSWLLASERPLSAAEVVAVVARYNSVSDDASQTHGEELLDENVILDLCCNFLVLDHTSTTFRFTHASVREYLQCLPEYSSSEVHFVATQRCLSYLIQGKDDIMDPIELCETVAEAPSLTKHSSPNTRVKSIQDRLRLYTTCYWAHHYSKIADSALRIKANQLLLEFIYDEEGICFVQWLLDVQDLIQSKALLPGPLLQELNAVQDDGKSPIFTASVYGLLAILKQLHAQATASGEKIDWDAKNAHGAPALYISARYGNVETLEFLLARGASVDILGGFFGNPLQAGAFHGHEAVVRTLLESGANPLAIGNFDTALHAALAGGHESVIELLQVNEAFPDPSQLDDVLSRASYDGHDRVVRQLLTRAALTQRITLAQDWARDRRHDALQAALVKGRARIVQTLLKELENVNVPGGHFGNAIQAAAFGGHEIMVLMMLKLVADANSEGRYVVRLLLDSGARIGDNQADALQAAAFNGRQSTVKLLLERGTNPIHRMSLPPALNAASSRGHYKIVQILLSSGSERSARSALAAALRAGQERVIEVLLKYLPEIADVDSPAVHLCSEGDPLDLLPSSNEQRPPSARKDGRDPLTSSSNSESSSSLNHSLSIKIYLEDPQALEFVSDGLDTDGDIAFGKGRFLRLAARKCSKEVVAALLDRGLDINNTGDSYGMYSEQPSPLEIAASAGNLEVVELLLDRGAQLKRTLQFAVRSAHREVIQLVLSKRPDTDVDVSVDPSTFHDSYSKFQKKRDASAQSALTLAIEWKHKHLVLMLLEHKAKSPHPEPGLSLIVAARNGNNDMVKLMLKRGRQAASPGSESESKRQFVILRAACEAAANDHMAVIRTILAQPDADFIRDTILSETVREAAAHGLHGIIGQVQSIARSTQHERLAGIALIALSGKKSERIEETSLQEVRNAFQRLVTSSNKSPIFEDYHRQALREALKAGNHGIAQLLLEEDTTHDFLKNETDILQVAIRAECNWFYRWRTESKSPRQIVEMLIAHGASPTSVDDEGNTPLYYTCAYGHSEIFQLLIESGTYPLTTHEAIQSADLEPRAAMSPSLDLGRVNLLQIALDARLESECGTSIPSIWSRPVQEKWGCIIIYFLDTGVRFRPDDPALVKFLHIACYQGNLAYVEKLVSKGVDLNARAGRSDKRDFDRGTALHGAAIGGQRAVAACLLQHGANVRTKSAVKSMIKIECQTAVIAALDIFQFNLELDRVLDVCEALVEAGAEENDCEALLEASAKCGKLEMVKRLLQRGIRIREIPFCGHLDVIRLLLENEGQIDSSPGRTAQFQKYAATNGHIEVMEHLVERSGPLLPMGDFGYIAFDVLSGGYLDMLRYLVTRYGHNVNATFPGYPGASQCVNLLQRACEECHINAVKFLLEYEADPDCPGLPDTALSYLFQKREDYMQDEAIKPVVQLLLDHGAHIDGIKKTKESDCETLESSPLKTPLGYSAVKGDLDMVKFLIARGADVNSGHIPPLRLARQIGRIEVTNLLIVNGAVDNLERSSPSSGAET